MSSIVGAIHEYYENHPRRSKPATGWPTGSRLGTCCAQLQQLRFGDRYPSEPLRARALRVFEQGDRIEAWLGERLRETYPHLVGLEQELFYFPIQLATEARVILNERITSRAIWGRVVPHFNEPRLWLGDDGRVKLRLMPRNPKEPTKPAPWGFVLDQERECLWVPTYIDYAVKHDTLGLAICECKSMSNYAFRRAVLGDLDYGKQCQLVGFARATGANVVLIAYRNETAHLAEIAYTRTVERTRVVLTKPNGGQDVFFVDRKLGDKTPLVPEAGGDPQGFPHDQAWETAETWTPYDPALEAAIDRRVLDVLLFDGDPASLRREAGPDFTCATCHGTGKQVFRKGTVIPLKEPKPCDDCQQTGMVEETELGFPCSYCPVVSPCFSAATPRFAVDDRPHWYITRQDYGASGITFARPEGAK